MKFPDYQNYQQLNPSDSEALWQAIEDMQPHLHDRLLLIEEFDFCQISPCRLVAFTANDTPLYAIASDGGKIIVGKTEQMNCHTSLNLADFDAQLCEIVTLSVTEQNSFYSDYLSLWVCVDRFEPGKGKQTQLYHARVGIDKTGELLLEPAHDDNLKAPHSIWQGQALKANTPNFFKTWNFTAGYGLDPFTMPPSVNNRLSAKELPSYNAISWHEDKLCYAIAKTLYLQTVSTLETKSLTTLTERISCLVLKKPEGKLQGIVGCKDYWLVFFEEDEQQELIERWRQKQSNHPVAMCFINDSIQDCEVLVLYSDGYLRRFRYMQADHISALWQQCWQQLGLGRNLDFADFLRQGKIHLPENEQRREAYLDELLQRLSDTAALATPEQRQQWLAIIKDEKLFSLGGNTDGLPPKVLNQLNKALITFAEGRQQPWPLANGNDLLPTLVNGLYDQLTLDDQQKIYRQLLSLNWSNQILNDAAVTELRDKVKATINDIWQLEYAPKDLKEHLRYADVALEYWANRFVASETVSFKKRFEKPGLVGVLSLSVAGQAYLLAVTSNTLALYSLAPNNDNLSPIANYSLPETLDNHQLMLVRKLCDRQQSGFLALTHLGTALIFMLEQSAEDVLQNPLIHPCANPDKSYYYWTAATCPSADGKTIIAIAGTEGRTADLQFYQVIDGDWLLKERHDLDIPWLSCLDLSANDSGYYLFAASDQAAESGLYRFDFNLKTINKPRKFNLLRNGVLYVAFDSKQDPIHLLCGGYNGLLWCIKIADEQINLCWSFQLTGFISAIEAIEMESEAHFLISSGSGEILLLNAAQGKRRWREYLNDAIYHIALIKGDKSGLALVQYAGRVNLFEEVTEQDRNLAATRIAYCLARLRATPSEDEGCQLNPLESVCIKALGQIDQQRRTAADVFKASQGRKMRGRILLYLAKNDLLARNPEIIQQLSFRELALSLSYTQTSAPIWRAKLAQELKRRNPSKTSDIVINAAQVVCLQYLLWEEPNLDRLFEEKPPEFFLRQSIWIRLEYARLLAITALKEKNHEQSLLCKLLPYLLQLSPRLIYRLQVAFPKGSGDNSDFKALDQLLQANAEPSVALERLIFSLKQHSSKDHLAGLLLVLAEFHQCMIENKDESWRDYRTHALLLLRALVEAIHAYTYNVNVASLKKQFIGALQETLPKTSIPNDCATLNQRSTWVAQAKNSLSLVQTQPKPEDKQSWAYFAATLFNKTVAIVSWVLEQEHQHLLRLVRPYVNLTARNITIGNKISLEFTLSAEGSRTLQDVGITLDASGKNGLLPSGRLISRSSYASFPFAGYSETITLDGFIAAEQQEICVLCSLKDQTGYSDETRWHFPLLRQNRLKQQRQGLETLLPDLYSAFREQVFAAKAAVTLVICDSQLGYEQFIEDWDNTFPHQRLNLDDKTQHIGPGRLYSASKLDYAFIENQLNNAANRQRLLLAPIEELVHRLAAEDNATALNNWCYQLNQPAKQDTQQGLILLVSSLTACILRKQGLQGVKEICAHQLLIQELAQKQPKTDYLTSLLTFMSERLALEASEADRVARQFGYDLRLILLWLQETGLTGERSEPEVFLAETACKQVIIAELQALPPIELINLLVGSREVSQLKRHEVQPGHIADDNYFSSTRKHAPKLIQKHGDAFTESSLMKFQADAYPPDWLQVQGFGTIGTAIQQDSHLYKLCKVLTKPQHLQSLAARGFGSFIGGIFRTGEPYRDTITQLYQSVAELSMQQQDNKVYSALFGEHHSPIELVLTEHLQRFSNEELQNLMPHASVSDIRYLRILEGIWQAEPTDANLLTNALNKLLPHDVVALMEPQTKRWDNDLLNLAAFCIGVGSAFSNGTNRYPETYVLWLADTGHVRTTALKTAIETSDKLRKAWLKDEYKDKELAYTPRIIITGPGSLAIEPDSERRYALIDFKTVCSAIWEGDLIKGLWRKIRVQWRLSTLSPFKTSGALPPGSAVFRGRDDELAFLQQRCRAASILIIGSRRVGKTSLLNQFYHWTLAEPDICAIYLDLQGIKTLEDFLGQLINAHTLTANQPIQDLIKGLNSQDKTALNTLTQAVNRLGQQTLFLFNEIDGLAAHEPALIESWRSLNDAGVARFIMTGYSVIGSLGLPVSAFFHFTEGTYYGGKAIALTALPEDSARAILDLLETSDLQLGWRSPQEKEQAYQLLLQHSYRIPWVLQTYGRLLVEQLEEQRQDLLTLHDVEKLLQAKGRIVWQYIQNIDYSKLETDLYSSSSSRRSSKGNFISNAQRDGVLVILYALVKHLYINSHPAPIRDSQLSLRNALDLGFSIADVNAIVNKTINNLALFDAEKDKWQHWYRHLELAKTLRLLTLTLILEPDPFTTDRYAFLLHIFPIELYRQYGEADPTLDNLITQTISNFLILI